MPNSPESDKPPAGDRDAACTTLPVERSFVVRFTGSTDPELASCVGRVEHVDSGRRQSFADLPALLDFLRQVLADGVGDGPA